MIASLGGASVAKDGSRIYPGAGGYVGGLSLDGSGNYSTIGGGGSKYNSVIVSESIEPPDGGGGCPAYDPSCHIDPPQGDTGGGNGGGGSGDTGGGSGDTGGSSGDTGDGPTTQIDGPTIFGIIQGLLAPSPRTSLGGSFSPLYVVNPASAGSAEGVNMSRLLILLAVAAVAFWAYKRYA